MSGSFRRTANPEKWWCACGEGGAILDNRPKMTAVWRDMRKEQTRHDSHDDWVEG